MDKISDPQPTTRINYAILLRIHKIVNRHFSPHRPWKIKQNPKPLTLGFVFIHKINDESFERIISPF